jgi:hypothetical protein
MKSIDLVTNDPVYPVANFVIKADIIETQPVAETPEVCK